MRRLLASHWRVWLGLAVLAVVVNEILDRNFFDHREHIDGDIAVAVIVVAIASFATYLVGRSRSRGAT